jgi:hypothetical protein
MKKTILTFAVVILMAAPAVADMVTDLGLDIDVSGDAVPAGSYSKTITITTRQAFDLLAVTPDPGLDDREGASTVRLSDPYLFNFSRTDWTRLTVPEPTGMLAAAQGTTATKSLRLSIELQPLNGSSRPQDDDAFIVAVWSPTKQYPVGEWEYEYRRIFFCFGVWQVETLTKHPEWKISRDELLTPVPAPAAIGLGMLGLGLVGWYMRRFA